MGYHIPKIMAQLVGIFSISIVEVERLSGIMIVYFLPKLFCFLSPAKLGRDVWKKPMKCLIKHRKT